MNHFIRILPLVFFTLITINCMSKNDSGSEEIDIERYTGVYLDNEGKQRLIYQEEGILYWTNSKGRKFIIYPISENRFLFKDTEESTLNFEFSEDNVKRVVLQTGDDKYIYKRTDLPIPDPKSPKMISNKFYEQILGDYSVGFFFSVEISKGNNSIIVDATLQETSEFYYSKDLTFYKSDEENVTIEFTKDNEGKINGFIVDFVDETMKAKKDD